MHFDLPAYARRERCSLPESARESIGSQRRERYGVQLTRFAAGQEVLDADAWLAAATNGPEIAGSPPVIAGTNTTGAATNDLAGAFRQRRCTGGSDCTNSTIYTRGQLLYGQ